MIVVLVFCVIAAPNEIADIPRNEKMSEALFLQLRRGNDLQKRCNAAAKLAQRQDAAAWNVLLLEDGNIYGDSIEENIDETLKKFDRAVTVVLLENIPTNASGAILWAVANNLSNKEYGEYSRKKTIGTFVIKRVFCRTRPIREVARETLKRCLGSDFQYDKSKWKQKILLKIKKQPQKNMGK